jgi:replication factor A1
VLKVLINLIASIVFIFGGIRAEMSSEKTIEQILLERPEISRDELDEKLKKERKKTGGLISDETLLRMIAAKLGVEIPNDKALTPTLSIKDLIPGLNDITVFGRVIAVFSPKAFEGKRSGKLASLLMADKSGILRVVLWNSKTSLVESGKIKAGQIIRVLHGYTRDDRSGKVELHIGEKSDIETNPPNVDAKNYVTRVFTTDIGEITQAQNNKRVNVAGTVRELFGVSDFQRQDSSSGRVMRFVLADETGEIWVVVWNEKVDEIEKALQKGARLQIVNAKVKKALGEKLEIHVDAGTYVDTNMPEEVFLKIADLNEDLGSVNVEGKVATKPMLREVKTSKGELVKLATFELTDETGKIWISAWRKHAEAASGLNIGNKIQIKNAYIKEGFSDQLEISTKSATSIMIVESNG